MTDPNCSRCGGDGYICECNRDLHAEVRLAPGKVCGPCPLCNPTPQPQEEPA